jgi:hypothetical protein
LVERCLCKADVSGSSPLTSSHASLVFLREAKMEKELRRFRYRKQNQSIKGIWWRPRDLEPMKGVITDDMPRGAGHRRRSEDSRMGQPKAFLLEFIEKRKTTW